MAKHSKARAKKTLAEVVPIVTVQSQIKVQSKPQPRKKTASKKSAKKSKPAPKSKARKPTHYGAPPGDMTPDPFNNDIHEIPSSAPAPRGGTGASGDVRTAEPEPAPERETPTPAPSPEPPVAALASETTDEDDELGNPNDKMLMGTQCVWLGVRSQAMDDSATGRPLCPFCGGPLVDTSDRRTMDLGLEQYELGVYTSVNPAPRPHPGYKKFVHWMMEQEECWPSIEIAALAYEEEKHIHVDPSR